MPAANGFEVVFVCTGNRARSPFAAELLRHQAATGAVSTGSRGVLDLGAARALPGAVWAARSFGIDLTSHRARPVVEGELESVDLVIGFEPIHVATAVVTGRSARTRTFLITELVDLLAQVRAQESSPLPAARAIELADAARVTPPTAKSIADPVGTSKENFRTTFGRISDLVAGINFALFDAGGSR